MATLFIVIPIYNEAATLQRCIRRVERAPLPDGFGRRLVLVDDASQDESPLILATLKDRHTVLRHETNRGKGGALLTAFDAILNHKAGSVSESRDYVIVQDADLEYNPTDYPWLLEPVIQRGARVVFGTRFGRHRRLEHIAAYLHERGNALLTKLCNALTGYDLTDMECGYKMLRVDVLRRIRPHLDESRFGIEPQMTSALARFREPIVEVPISYIPRSFTTGKKIKWTDGVRALWVMYREGMRRKLEE